MSDNPYAHAASSRTPALESAGPVPNEMPRFAGRCKVISGEIDRASAFELARECAPIDTGSARRQKNFSWRFSCIWFLFAVATFAVLILFPGVGPQADPPEPDLIDRVLFIVGLIIMPTFIFSMLIYLRYRYRKGVRDADPPVYGHWEFHMHPEWFRAIGRSDDDRYVEMYLPWKHTLVQRSDRAWYLCNSGLIHALIPYSWIGSIEDFRELDGFFHQLSFWRARAGISPSVPVENETEIFGELPAGLPFQTSGWKESANISRMRSTIRQHFPNYRKVYRWIIMPWFWMSAGIIQVALASCWLVYTLAAGQSPGVLILVFGIVMLFGFLAIFFGSIQRTYFSALTTGVISGPEIWFNRGPVRFRMLVTDFNFRAVMDSSLVLSRDKSSRKVFILSSSAFGGAQNLAEACRLTGATTAV